jgi:hypothetical protein
MRFALLAVFLVACSGGPVTTDTGSTGQPDAAAEAGGGGVDASPDTRPAGPDAAADVAPDVAARDSSATVDVVPDASVVSDVTCADGESACGGSDCLDLSTDESNCGLCGRACPADQVCRGATCVCPQDVCGNPGVCVDTRTDPQNCNACGNTCPSVRPRCVDGSCVQ